MSEGDTHLTLLLTGDVMIGRGVDQLFDIHCDPQLYEPWVTDARHYVSLAEAKHGSIPQPVSYAYVWGDFLEDCATEKPDFRMINLETSLTLSNAYAPRKGIHYRAHPSQVGILRAANIDGCVLGNNHILDWGRDGLEETLKTLKNANIRWAGAGLNAHAAEEGMGFSLSSKNLEVVAWGSVTSGIPLAWQAGMHQSGVNILECSSLSHVLKKLQGLKPSNNVVLVSIHWGDNWGYDIPHEQRSLAHALIDQGGASIVHFHSSHHPKAIEIHSHRLILYGAGDLINDYEGIEGYEEYLPDLGVTYFPRIDGTTGQLLSLRMRVYARRNMRLIRATEKEVMDLSSLLREPCLALGTRLSQRAGNSLTIEFS